MVDFAEAIEYPTKSDDWVITLLIGGVLTLFGITFFLVMGYLVAVIRGSLNNVRRAPEFDDWGRIAVDGLKSTLILIVYALVPGIVVIGTVGASLFGLLTGSTSFGAAIGGILFGLAVSSILGLVFSYLGAIGLINFVEEDSIGAAFSVGTILSVGTSSEYLVAFVGVVAVFFGYFVVATFLNLVPFIGFILAAFPAFYASGVGAKLLADGFAEARGRGARARY